MAGPRHIHASRRQHCRCGDHRAMLCAAVRTGAPASPLPRRPPRQRRRTSAAGPGSLNGIWTAPGYKGSMRTPPRDRVYRTIDGKWPPLLPAAAELLEKRISMSEKGEPYINTIMQCLPGGVPEMVFGAPYPAQIIETPGQVTILYEMYNHFRVIHLNGKHPADPDPGFMGHSDRPLGGRHAGGGHGRPDGPDHHRRGGHSAQRRPARHRAVSPHRCQHAGDTRSRSTTRRRSAGPGTRK